MSIIKIEGGNQNGQCVLLAGQDLVVFGWDSRCQVSFEDPLASRRHFSIELQV
tara:strand:- start:1189 stop:1347 length:159 start_codon:yes stop_codon:yes gene_type:complete